MKKLIIFLFIFNFTNLYSSDLKFEKISDDLDKPWSLSFIDKENVIITEKSGKLIDPRKLHPTQFFLLCPAETPEGGNVGIRKNMSLSVKITNRFSIEPVYHILQSITIY